MPKVEPMWIYGFVRLDITPSQRAVQFGHACIAMMTTCNLALEAPTANVVLLAVSNEIALIEVSKYLTLQKTPFEMFYEPDRDMGYSAICLAPVGEEMKTNFQMYNLLDE